MERITPNSQRNFLKLNSGLCEYSDAYIIGILVKGSVTINEAEEARNLAERQIVRENDERNKGIIFNNCASFIDCEINNNQVDNAKSQNVVMSTYNLIEYSNNS